MKKFPEEVYTITKKGKTLVRNLIGRGKFVCYDYRDPDTFEKAENGKIRIFLRDEKTGKLYSYFLIPLKNKRWLAIEADTSEGKTLWNEEKGKAEDLWEEEK